MAKNQPSFDPLAAGLDSLKRRAKTYKFLVDGDTQVGKSSLVRVYSNSQQDASASRNDFLNRVTRQFDRFGEDPCFVELHDLRPAQRGEGNAFYSEFDGVLVMFALDDYQSFNNLTSRFNNLTAHISDELKHSFPCFVLANKSDKKSNIKDSIVQEWCKKRETKYLKISTNDVDIMLPTLFNAINSLVNKCEKFHQVSRRDFLTPGNKNISVSGRDSNSGYPETSSTTCGLGDDGPVASSIHSTEGPESPDSSPTMTLSSTEGGVSTDKQVNPSCTEDPDRSYSGPVTTSRLQL